MAEVNEDYKGFRIEGTRVPDQPGLELGFGWFFKICRIYQDVIEKKMSFSVVIKCFTHVDQYIETVYIAGLSIVKQKIDEDDFEAKKYCYSWALDGGAQEAECKKIGS